jgi:hypothetical protein
MLAISADALQGSRLAQVRQMRRGMGRFIKTLKPYMYIYGGTYAGH